MQTVLIHGLSGSNWNSVKGGVDFRRMFIARELAKLGITIADLSEESSFSNHPGLIYVATQGLLSRTYLEAANGWLQRGWSVVEHNIFGLASPFRPSHPNYRVALSSEDTALRFQIRQALRTGKTYSRFFVLPHPYMWPLASSGGRKPHEVAVFCRIGRPDPRKWSNFEVSFASRLAEMRPDLEVRLNLLGSPYPAPKTSLSNLDIRMVDYGAPLEDVLTQSNFYLHESRIGETFGNVFLEARVAGLRTIAAIDPSRDAGHLEILPMENAVLGSSRGLVRDADQAFELAVGRQPMPVEVETWNGDFLRRLLDPSSGSLLKSFGSFPQHIQRLNSRIEFGSGKHPAKVAVRLAAEVITRTNECDDWE